MTMILFYFNNFFPLEDGFVCLPRQSSAYRIVDADTRLVECWTKEPKCPSEGSCVRTAHEIGRPVREHRPHVIDDVLKAFQSALRFVPSVLPNNRPTLRREWKRLFDALLMYLHQGVWLRIVHASCVEMTSPW